MEFVSGIANMGGSCDGQAIVPENGHYRCYCCLRQLHGRD
ncbi:hypothetical protein I553_5078 [Mycobacterium xenopi 4042]|uniref:Uncharacterized protein n=1 Tax=Mycobacterium xenopi 4042 TaxID=1299334 RepID=X7ZX16_MYCXE|nr:hypothetical protein I553_5078 [Mycobacterium xenopi 4042]